MSQDVKVCVLFGFGINCDRETAAVFEMVGGSSERLHVNRLVHGERSLSEFDILAVPGGFSFGDHLGSGRLLGNRLRFALREQLQKFVTDGKPVIGICNGFQALVKTGLLPGPADVSLEPDLVQRASLTLNNTGRYEDRWVTLEFDSNSPCIWTKGMQRIECPVRHGEGRFVMPTEQDLDNLQSNHLLAVRYVDPTTPVGEGIQDELLPFPMSPNGSMRNIAGICDSTGLVFGLMPHPEAAYATFLHPHHTRSEVNEEILAEGMQIFRNAVEYAQANL
ncbi:MAG: phosphoribosylformylglycinamidine synthase subunit PurQ [Candidatus Thermoplasmatota archaeon]|nr:phosphoribosylformylglycinamidine synthase subunit PurQ [Candidatus Thermoplasmatota archaeon]